MGRDGEVEKVISLKPKSEFLSSRNIDASDIVKEGNSREKP